MPANTPKYALPYPLPTEPVAEGAQAIRNLAERLDAYAGLTILAETQLAAAAPTMTFPASLKRIATPSFIWRYTMTRRADWTRCFGSTEIRAEITSGSGYFVSGATPNGSASGGGSGYLHAGGCPGNNASADTYSASAITFPDYSRTNTRKMCFSNGGFVATGTGMYLDMFTGYWSNPAAITSLTMLFSVAGNYAAGSRMSLYGIR